MLGVKTKQQIQDHWEDAIKIIDKKRIVGVFCQGSQNYNLNDDNSDMDTKCIFCPCLDDFFKGKEIGRGNFTYYRPNQEHIVFTDIRSFIRKLKDGSPNFVELLFSKVFIINPIYEEFWQKLIDNREAIARYNEPMAVKSMNRMVQAKCENLKIRKTYPSRMYTIDNIGYDPKELSHEIRVCNLLKDYIEGNNFESCLLGIKATEEETIATRRFIKDIKRNVKWTYEEAVKKAQEYADLGNKLQETFMAKNKYWYGNPKIDIILQDVSEACMVKSINLELKNYIS